MWVVRSCQARQQLDHRASSTTGVPGHPRHPSCPWVAEQEEVSGGEHLASHSQASGDCLTTSFGVEGSRDVPLPKSLLDSQWFRFPKILMQRLFLVAPKCV